MKQDGKFLLMDRQELKSYITCLKNVKKFSCIQQHHTAAPSYKDVKNNNFQLMKGMEDYHVKTLKMSEIAQHFSTFPDGSICTGRPLTKDGGGFYGNQNLNSITIENVGNFDVDIMTDEQRESIILLNALLCRRFDITPSAETLPYHCWVKNKSCPGTGYFGGNTKEKAESNFIPAVKAEIEKLKAFEEALKTVAEKAGTSYDFWLRKRGIDPSFEALIIKIAKSYGGKLYG
ncbi:N-acetylmuramoyl-L-alanine amidase [Ruminiclostridium hungatei]|uniref:N-acetylmuramoyl-L-alanine amidase n=1 Tax=Ruminiclostridium hungatei TaxID=48256 RepID=A0A1V4SIZ9_RUMHU|nr:peptidoglycan recognition family protein [Ruminiclostridium hungatei]OPX43840.1 N-acetylmuramoyl-L-alanine amidase [Ruminiclostridium hungatei]